MTTTENISEEILSKPTKTVLTDIALRTLTELGIDLSGIEDVSAERIRNINFIFSEENYKTNKRDCPVYIKFANDLLKASLTQKSKELIERSREAKTNSTCLPPQI